MSALFDAVINYYFYYQFNHVPSNLNRDTIIYWSSSFFFLLYISILPVFFTFLPLSNPLEDLFLGLPVFLHLAGNLNRRTFLFLQIVNLFLRLVVIPESVLFRGSFVDLWAIISFLVDGLLITFPLTLKSIVRRYRNWVEIPLPDDHLKIVSSLRVEPSAFMTRRSQPRSGYETLQISIHHVTLHSATCHKTSKAYSLQVLQVRCYMTNCKMEIHVTKGI